MESSIKRKIKNNTGSFEKKRNIQNEWESVCVLVCWNTTVNNLTRVTKTTKTDPDWRPPIKRVKELF